MIMIWAWAAHSLTGPHHQWFFFVCVRTSAGVSEGSKLSGTKILGQNLAADSWICRRSLQYGTECYNPKSFFSEKCWTGKGTMWSKNPWVSCGSSLEGIQGKCLIRIAWASVRLGSPGSQLVWMRLLRGVACMCGVIDPIRQAWQVKDDNLDSCRMWQGVPKNALSLKWLEGMLIEHPGRIVPSLFQWKKRELFMARRKHDAMMDPSMDGSVAPKISKDYVKLSIPGSNPHWLVDVGWMFTVFQCYRHCIILFSAMSWSAGWTESSGNRGFGYSCAWGPSGPSASVKVIQSQYTPKIIPKSPNWNVENWHRGSQILTLLSQNLAEFAVSHLLWDPLQVVDTVPFITLTFLVVKFLDRQDLVCIGEFANEFGHRQKPF